MSATEEERIERAARTLSTHVSETERTVARQIITAYLGDDHVVVPKKAVDFICGIPEQVRQTEAAHYKYSDKPFIMKDFGFDPDFVQRMSEVERLIQAKGER